MLETHTSLDMFVLRVINQQRYLLLEPFVFFFFAEYGYEFYFKSFYCGKVFLI